MSSALQLRPLTAADLDQAVAIELRATPSPWNRQAFLDELQHAHAACLGAFGADGDLLGYLLIRQVLDEAEICNLASHPDHRRRGIATALLADFLQRARGQGVVRVHLEVRAGNDPAQALYRRHGFVECGRRPRYYRPGGEDAVLMALDLAAATQG